MIFVYSVALFLLGLVHFLIKRRVASLEKKYLRVVREADELVRKPLYREGNSNRLDPVTAAKRQYTLGVLGQKRDHVEARYTSWLGKSERLAKWIARVRGWKGRTLPYTFGALDVAFFLTLADYLGFGDYVGTRKLVEVVVAMFKQ
jgi:hypothetical protein